MTDVWINGRPATAHEADAGRHGRRCEMERDMEQLAGVLTETRQSAPLPGDRHVTDLARLQ
jgi:hypothetical protein